MEIHNEVSGPVSIAIQAGSVDGTVNIDTGRPAVPPPAQLPAAVRGFTGRADALALLDDRVLRQRVPVTVVTGPGGVGKTALTVRWARSRADRFPDGQLYADLQGYGPTDPLDAADVLGSFLRGLGVPDREIPGPAHERASYFRSALAGRRVLVVLDNAAGADQVRPLLPGHETCAVVVTSRDALHGLAVHDGAELVGLDLLDAGQSLDFLGALLGDRVHREPAAADLVACCAGLPLALGVAAQLVLSRPGAPLATLAAELAGERDRLDVLELGDDTRSAVRSVLSWSYQRLTAPAARAFRLLGVHPGRGVDGRAVDVPAVAALCGVPIGQAARALRALAAAHLVVESSPGWYSTHDLLRLYAVELCEREDHTEVAHARERLFDHYLHTADQADRLVTPHRYRVPLDGSPERAERFADYPSALGWLHAHWRDAAALCRWDDPALDTRRWQLAYTLRGYFFLAKEWHGWIGSHEPALAACLRLGDRHAEARIRNDLGRALLESGRPDAGAVQYEAAQRLFEEVGDRHGWSNAVANRAVLLRRSGDPDGALRLNATALDHYTAAGARRNTAIAWRSRAKMHVDLGALDEAAADLGRAMEVFAELGSQLDIAEARNLAGVIAARRGQLLRAEEEHLEALEASRACGSRYEEAEALRRLGELAAGRGAVRLAITCWNAALRLHRAMGSSGTAELAAKVRSHGGDPDREA